MENPQPGSLQPELLSPWRQPSSTQSWPLDSFALNRMVQPRGIQSRSTAAGGCVYGCNALSGLTGEALGSMRGGPVTSLRKEELSTKLFGSANTPAP